tara:strand:- start:52195 stop:52905 length:711 start_codon:yes stop_codon:yes gene_type:complete
MFRRLLSVSKTLDNADDGDRPSPHRARIGKPIGAKLRRNPLVTRIESDKVEIYARRAFATAEECAALRAIIDAGAQPSQLFSGTQGPEYRSSMSAHMGDGTLIAEINARIVALMGADGATGEPIQGQRYTKGQEYKPHCDYFPAHHKLWQEVRPQGGQRCWTAMIYASDVAAGGETWFPHARFSVPPVEGTILLWNNLLPDGAPNENTLHAAKPVREGVKYVLTKWFRERAWKPKA